MAPPSGASDKNAGKVAPFIEVAVTYVHASLM